MRFLFAVIIVVSFFATCNAEKTLTWEVKTKEESNLGISDGILFVSMGARVPESHHIRYRVIMAGGLYAAFYIEKLQTGTEDGPGKVIWSRSLNFSNLPDKLDRGLMVDVNFPEFPKNFRWLSVDSFSFKIRGVRYEISQIGSEKPIFKIPTNK